MAEQRTYSHIKVGATDADRVIYAGVHGQQAHSRANEPALVGAAVCVEQGETAAAAAAEAPTFGLQGVRATGSDAQAPTQAAGAPSVQAAEADPRPLATQQTLEDLQAGPMPGLQRGVLAAAALFVVGFCVYWFVLRAL